MVAMYNGVDNPEMTIVNDMMRKGSNKAINGQSLLSKSTSEEDDLIWHERQLSRRRFIKGKIDEYINGFTVHGLTRVFIGSRIEKVFWFFMLCAGVVLSAHIISNLATKYFRFQVYTEIRAQITEQNFFPSVTICEYQLFRRAYFSYCGMDRHKAKGNKACQHGVTNTAANATISSSEYWSNGFFNVTKCKTWDGKTCATDQYFKSLAHFNHACVTWNYNGDLHDIYSHVDISFRFTSPQSLNRTKPVIIAIPHDSRIEEIDMTKKVDMELGKNYMLNLDKTFIKRLPAPFPSNCSHEKMGDIFPGKYTRRSCIESQNYIAMYKQCGDIFDYVRKFLPMDKLRKYQQNRSISETLKCIKSFKKMKPERASVCAFPCEELELSLTTTFHERRSVTSLNDELDTYGMDLQYQSVDTFKVMEEKELYSWDQMACEIGGFIGLVIGASILSVIEILAYIVLRIAKEFV